MDLQMTIRHAARWREHWRSVGDEEMLRLLEEEGSELSRIRSGFVLASLRRYDEARARVTGGTALELSTRAVIDIHEAGASGAARAQELCEGVTRLSAVVPQGDDLVLSFEAQAVLDLMRGQAYEALGLRQKSRELLKSAVKLGNLIGMNTSYPQKLLDDQQRSPRQRLDAEKRRLKEAQRSGDAANTENAAIRILELKALLCDLGDYRYYLSLLLPSPLKEASCRALTYCLTNRHAPLPEEGGAPLGDLARRMNLLERALFAQWTFDHQEACRLAHELLDLPELTRPGSPLYACWRLLRARAYMVLHDRPSATAEIVAAEEAPISLRRLMQIEGALLSREPIPEGWLAQANVEHSEFLDSVTARLLPNALVLMADTFGGEWRTLSRARVHQMSESLYRTGRRNFQSPEDRKRVESLKRVLGERPMSVAYGFLMPLKEVG